MKNTISNGATLSTLKTVAPIDQLCGLPAHAIYPARSAHRCFTLSCGIAVIDELGEDALSAETLIDMADRRLYLAKQSGRNRCVWADISP